MKDSVIHLHLVCQDSARELKFFKSEIPFFKKRLEEVISKNSSKEVAQQVEHFENRFRLLDIHFDEMLHELNLKIDWLEDTAKAKPTFIHLKVVESNDNLLELITKTTTDFASAKKEFYHFLSKTM